MPTIREVAKLAGAAPITVSRVVNDSGYVSKETSARVEAAVEELGYLPNMLGPSLPFSQTMTLATVVTDIADPF